MSDWNSSLRVQMGSQSKLRVGDEDKISELPDVVLSHMLSFLATKYAVRTSVLSTRWKNIWASVPNLDFEHKHGLQSDHVGFLSFVDRVLYYRNSSDIQRFRLHFNGFAEDFSRIDGWIRTAIRRNVVELDLRVKLKERRGQQMFELPKSVFLCKTLVVLKLISNCISYAPPKSECFPNLKVLHIRVDYPDNVLMEKLFSYFPLLEDLTIEGEMLCDIPCNFKLSVPELKTLRMYIDSANTEQPYKVYFSINAPKLESLDLKLDILPSILFENAKSLVKAVVNFYYHEAFQHEDFCNHATTLLAAISNVEYLSLSAHLLDASCLPAFDNLIQLKLVLHDCYHWELLAEMLKRSPNLECLVLEHKQDMYCIDSEDEEKSEDEENSTDEEKLEDEGNSEDEVNIEDESNSVDKGNSEDAENSKNEEISEDEEYAEHPWWNEEEFAPICLLSHLKTISIKGFKGRQDEKEMAKYLLKNGEVLKKITIYMGDFMYSKEAFYKEFALFQRGSRSCRVKFM